MCGDNSVLVKGGGGRIVTEAVMGKEKDISLKFVLSQTGSRKQ